MKANDLTLEDLEKIIRSPTLFAINVLGIKPFDYQVRILEDDSSRMIIVGGRGIGKTTTLGMKALWNAFVKPNYEVLIVAPTLRQSKIMYDVIRKLIRRSDLIKVKSKVTMHETRFDNDSVIRIAPIGDKGEVARGYHVDMLIFDEVAFMNEEAILSIEPSVTSKDGIIIYSSTPYGVNNRFYRLYSQYLGVWSVYQIPTWQSPLVKEGFLEQMRKTMTEEQYMQEFGAKFIDDVGLLYPNDLILKNCYDYTYESVWNEENTIMGVDVASGTGNDESAITIVAKMRDGKYKVIFSQTYKSARYTDLAEIVLKLAERFSVRVINIERNGVGDALYNILNERNIYGYNVNGFYSVGKERLDMYYNVKALLEKGELILSKNDTKLIKQAGNFEVKEGKDGSIRVVKGKGHDDKWDSLVYALYEKRMRVDIIEDFGRLI